MENSKIEYQKNKVKYHLDRLSQLGYKDFTEILKPYLPLPQQSNFYLVVARNGKMDKFVFDNLELACIAYCKEVYKQLLLKIDQQKVYKNLVEIGIDEVDDEGMALSVSLYNQQWFDRRF